VIHDSKRVVEVKGVKFRPFSSQIAIYALATPLNQRPWYTPSQRFFFIDTAKLLSKTSFPHLQFKQLYRVSRFNPIGLALTAFITNTVLQYKQLYYIFCVLILQNFCEQFFHNRKKEEIKIVLLFLLGKQFFVFYLYWK
jgi:hypothetical protein